MRTSSGMTSLFRRMRRAHHARRAFSSAGRFQLDRLAAALEVVELPFVHRVLDPPLGKAAEGAVQVHVLQRHVGIIGRFIRLTTDMRNRLFPALILLLGSTCFAEPAVRYI